jgi:uncharacterized protein (TIGR02284 family)
MVSLVHVSPEVAHDLSSLVHANLDSSKSFDEASRTIEAQNLGLIFRAIAVQRRDNAEQLKRYVAVAEPPASESSIRGTLHRWWVRVRGALQHDHVSTLLAEAERSEEAIKKAYESALMKVALDPIAGLLGKQYRNVRQQRDQIRDLRERSALVN